MIQNMKIKQKIWVDEKMTYKNYLDQEDVTAHHQKKGLKITHKNLNKPSFMKEWVVKIN